MLKKGLKEEIWDAGRRWDGRKRKRIREEWEEESYIIIHL
jgi:hypothetical protein